MRLVTDYIKRTLIGLDLFPQTLHSLKLITYQERTRWRSESYHREILFEQQGQDLIAGLLAGGAPLMVTRLGSVELWCLSFYLRNRCRNNKPYPGKIRSTMRLNAGFFPADDRSLDAFCAFYLEKLAQADLLGVWFNRYEEVICNSYCPNARLVEIGCLEPFRYGNPWSRNLAGKRVLVVHPFAHSIRTQYEKRRLLFPSPDVLPDFELKTIRAVQSLAGARVDFPSWFDAYRHMCEEMAATDFDVCIIGAGAYGLPLAAFAKEMGKQAIHMGGVTQILFGIKGKRWEDIYADSTAKLFNEHWVRPSESEVPEGKEKVENGCYW